MSPKTKLPLPSTHRNRVDVLLNDNDNDWLTNEALPPLKTPVIAFSGGEVALHALYQGEDGRYWAKQFDDNCKVSFWMPLPCPPNVVGKI